MTAKNPNLAQRGEDHAVQSASSEIPRAHRVLGEGRRPSDREVKSVAKRILREAFPEREVRRQSGTRFYRDMFPAARATLGMGLRPTLKQEQDG